jgi:hypothetical protein
VAINDTSIDEFVTRLVCYVFAEQSRLLIEYEFAKIESVSCNFGEKEDVSPFDGVVEFIVFEFRFLHVEQAQNHLIMGCFSFRYFHFGLLALLIEH